MIYTKGKDILIINIKKNNWFRKQKFAICFCFFWQWKIRLNLFYSAIFRILKWDSKNYLKIDEETLQLNMHVFAARVACEGDLMDGGL